MIRLIAIAMLPFGIANCSWMEVDYTSGAKTARCEQWQCIADYQDHKHNSRIEQEEVVSDSNSDETILTPTVPGAPPQTLSPLSRP
ncbi:MAG: hypothetical protein ACN2B6_10375 [Rickettsiales bacterium]